MPLSDKGKEQKNRRSRKTRKRKRRERYGKRRIGINEQGEKWEKIDKEIKGLRKDMMKEE